MNKPIRVLVVDDDETFCRFLTEVLEGRGMAVSWTTDSLAGYRLSLQQEFDLFVVDVRMPLVLGTEFAEALKKEEPGARIILISAFADKAAREAAKRLGVSLLSKPFSTDSFLELIERTLLG